MYRMINATLEQALDLKKAVAAAKEADPTGYLVVFVRDHQDLTDEEFTVQFEKDQADRIQGEALEKARKDTALKVIVDNMDNLVDLDEATRAKMIERLQSIHASVNVKGVSAEATASGVNNQGE
jgi:sugar phosphate isomerase/epimerase